MHLKQLNFMRWSKTHRCFYIPNKEHYIRRLKDHCAEVVKLDQQLINSRSSDRAENLSDLTSVILSEEVIRSIRKLKIWMEQKRYSYNTIKTYISFVTSFFSSQPHIAWDGITKDHIIVYNHRYFIQRKRSYSTQNQWINAIKMYLRVHHLDIGDLQDIERPKKAYNLPNVLSTEEVERIIRATYNMKHRALLMLIYSAGLRIGDVLSLELNDIKGDERLMHIRGGKGNKDRLVPLSNVLLKQLRAYYVIYKPKRYLFEGREGVPYASSSAQKVLKKAVAKAGIGRKVTLHTLRHSYATHLTNRGVNVQYLQEILGHKSPKTTMLYTHLSGKDIRNIKSPLDDLNI